jgi:LysM repeat protein
MKRLLHNRSLLEWIPFKCVSLCFLGAILGAGGCSPVKSSPYDDKHQLELTLHEVQTNLDDLRHDIHCFHADFEILNGRMKHAESSLSPLKLQEFAKQETKVEQLSAHFQHLEKKLSVLEKNQETLLQDRNKWAAVSQELNLALTDCKNRVEGLEKQSTAIHHRFEELSKLKGSLEVLTQSLKNSAGHALYKVKAGDSLEKIAKSHQTDVDRLKKANKLEQDLIVVGQELKIPD